MKSLAKSCRVNTALQVIQNMNAGMTVIESFQVTVVPILRINLNQKDINHENQ